MEVGRSSTQVATETNHQVTPQDVGSQHVTLAEFMESGILDNKNEKIMQVDGMDTESESETEVRCSGRWQVDGTHDNSDSALRHGNIVLSVHSCFFHAAGWLLIASLLCVPIPPLSLLWPGDKMGSEIPLKNMARV